MVPLGKGDGGTRGSHLSVVLVKSHPVTANGLGPQSMYSEGDRFMRSKVTTLASLSVFLISGVLAFAEGTDFKPDPAAVVRYGPAYRYPDRKSVV